MDSVIFDLFFSKAFLEGPYWEGLIYGGKFAIQSLIVGGKFTVFALFYFLFESNFQVQAAQEGGGGGGLNLVGRFK